MRFIIAMLATAHRAWRDWNKCGRRLLLLRTVASESSARSRCIVNVQRLALASLEPGRAGV